MASLSATQLSWTLSAKKSCPKNPNFRRLSFINCTNRTMGSGFHSIRWPSSRASIEASCDATVTDISERSLTLRDLCEGHVPGHILRRVEEVGFVVPTEVQRQALPILLSGRDCILHAQTGSGKTLAYLLSIFSVINTRRSAVQALVVVPTRELGMQVAKVARVLAAKPAEVGMEACSIMALLDGGMLRRHKSWLKVSHWVI
ncbi:hypothetical protein U1Q18_052704 [Sarracenia purpurea var. burkii]